jgi:hypothetical protein
MARRDSDHWRRKRAENAFHCAADRQKLAITSFGAVEFEANRQAFGIQIRWNNQARQATCASGCNVSPDGSI